MTTALLFSVTCPACGGPVVPTTNVPLFRDESAAGVETKIGMRCATNGRHGDFVVVVSLERVRSDGAPCGTVAGYQRHRRAGDEPCCACREAHARGANPDRRPIGAKPSWEDHMAAARRERQELLNAR